MIKKLAQKKIYIIDIVAVFLLIGTYLYCTIVLNNKFDFQTNVNLEMCNAVSVDTEGSLYIVDKSKSRAMKVKDEKVDFIIEGTGGEGSFMQAEEAVPDEQGGLYLHNIEWDASGFAIAREQILHYDAEGDFDKVSYEKAYTKKDSANKKRIFDIKSDGTGVRFLYADEREIQNCLVDDNGEAKIQKTWKYENAVTLFQSVSYDRTTGNVYAADKRGAIVKLQDEKNEVCYRYPDASKETPYSIAVGEEGVVYFSEVYTKSIYKLDTKAGIQRVIDAPERLKRKNMDGDGVMLSLFVNKENQVFTAFDNTILCNCLDENSGTMVSTIDKNIWSIGAELLGIILVIISLIMGVYLLLRGVFVILSGGWHLTVLHKIELVMVLSITIVSAVVLTWVGKSYRASYTDSFMNKLETVATIGGNTLDCDVIQRIDSSSDFMSEDYKKLINEMRMVVSKHFDDDKLLGAELYKCQGDEVYAIAYPDMSIGAYYPVGEARKQDILTVMKTKKSFSDLEQQKESGTFLSVMAPVYDKNGEVQAVLSIGGDSYAIGAETDGLMRSVTVNTFVLLIFLIFIINELMGVFAEKSAYQSSKIGITTIGGRKIPMHILRIIIFLSVFALNTVSSFLPVFTLSFYREGLGIPQSLAGAIPLAINGLFLAISALICPKVLRHMRFKPAILIGALCAVCGDLLVGLGQSYYIIVLALALNGFGYGMLYNLINIFIGKIDEADKRSRGFSILNASSIAGINCGMIAGAFMVTFLEYNQVFFVTATLWGVVAVVFCLLGSYIRGEQKEGEKREKKKAPLLSKSIFSYLFLLCIPYYMCYGFIYYYVPLYGNQYGYSEKEVSLLLIITAMCSVFFGNALVRMMQKTFGRKSIYIAFALALSAILMIAVSDNVFVVVFGLLDLGISVSFGIPLMMEYFLQKRQVREWGEERAIGVYGFMNSVGQSFSSIVFSQVLAAGMMVGTLVFTGVCVAMSTIERLISRRSEENK